MSVCVCVFMHALVHKHGCIHACMHACMMSNFERVDL